MNRARPRLRLALVSFAAAAALVLAGCSSPGSDDLDPAALPTPSATATATPAPAATTTACTNDGSQLASYAPDGATSSATLDRIRTNGSLRVGVSADTLLMGSRNPLSGQIEGFDIDVLHEISRAIFGDPDRLQFTVITSAQRIPALQAGTVDIVARTMTINCDRWQQIAFSTEYYAAGLKILVASNNEAASIQELEGKSPPSKVCAPASTTTLTALDQYDVEPVSAATHTGCLVLFQQGQVDAIAGDDTILAGFAAQDPYAKVIGEQLTSEPYGLGMNLEQDDLVRFVNGVLDSMRADGRWQSIYQKWLGELGAATPPAAVYGR
ncbi:glutamate ABC transporter substrate-binding protein [Microbacteriaceae bacterium VKM Ac-2855]|nr:glutamate ABC transporter substrate-binding protein [Microbacteriaceae bacterium VKM Ac-2855]